MLLHNGQLADPRNIYAKALKAVTTKRKKTDADYEEIAKLEWMASLYRFNDDLVLPDYMVEGVFIQGAKKSRRAPDARAGIYVINHASLLYPGKPASIDDAVLEAMFASGDYVHTAQAVVNSKKVMRTRPIFREWSALVEMQYDPDVLNLRDVEQFVTDAGRLSGVGDWRPKHGRFEAKVVDRPAVTEQINQQLLAV